MDLEKLLPKWNCPRCGDWFHMPYKFCACNTRRPQSEQKIMPGQTKFIGDYDITNLGKSVVYVGKVERKMTILDELERLSKEATPGPWDARVNEFSNTARPRHIWCEHGWTGRFYGEYGAVNADFVAAMRNNIDALIQVARAAQSIVKAHYTDATCKDCTGETNHVEQLLESLERLDKLEQVSNG